MLRDRGLCLRVRESFVAFAKTVCYSWSLLVLRLCCRRRSSDVITRRHDSRALFTVWAAQLHFGFTKAGFGTVAGDIRHAKLCSEMVDYLRRGLDELFARSEERRVGKECRSRWSQYH